MSLNITLNNKNIENLIDIANAAGLAIMKIYKKKYNIITKVDNSPLTEADTNSNDIITNGLNKLLFDIPILSEEGTTIAYEERMKWDYFWLIDPLDGTKEFIKKNDEFTVNIGLMKNNVPIFGVVHAPALKLTYWGGENIGSFKIENNKMKPISVNSTLNKPIKIATSRSHSNSKMEKFLSQFDSVSLHPMGSSLKMCLVADGTIDCYPRLGPTMEWDTAASHAIIKAAGGEMYQYGKSIPLSYNKKNLLNPNFIAGSKNIIETNWF